MKFLGKRKLKGAFLVIFIVLLLVPLTKSVIIYGDYFWGNLLPEITGVALEFVIILFVIDHIQKNTELNNKIKAEKRLREMLIFFLHKLNKYVPEEYHVGNFYGKDHVKNKRELSAMKHYIQTFGLDESAIKEIRIHCKDEIAVFNSFIPVVATLEEVHLKSWMRISYYMNAIISEKETVQFSVFKILEKIELFDEESYRKKIIVS
ncbi:hypothetical protein RBI69_13300 [Citrobacter portucalensis]|uniref:hypothetical protein n=1 Tax=Citrobacter portucalensis TaxID=1639133 RepID=UPI0027CCEFA6|nr:hypothetical protein [Citrobacter portucalensis]